MQPASLVIPNLGSKKIQKVTPEKKAIRIKRYFCVVRSSLRATNVVWYSPAWLLQPAGGTHNYRQRIWKATTEQIVVASKMGQRMPLLVRVRLGHSWTTPTKSAPDETESTTDPIHVSGREKLNEVFHFISLRWDCMLLSAFWSLFSVWCHPLLTQLMPRKPAGCWTAGTRR